MPLIRNQQPIQTFGPSGSNKPFRTAIRLRGLDRRPNDPSVLALKDRVEAASELAVVVANQELDWLRALGKAPGDLPRLLRDPLGIGVCRAAGEVHATAAKFDEEQ